MTIEVNGVVLWYEKTGQGEPIILLHGNSESHKIFDVLIGQLAENFTVYAIDSRGHGESSKTTEMGYGMMAEDVKAFITALNINKPYLYGFSDGGIIGLILASKYPDLLSKLIISGANSNPEGVKGKWRILFKIIHKLTKDSKVEMMLYEPHLDSDDLQRIKIPVLVLAGEKDLVKQEDTEFIAMSIPNSKLHILEHESHTSYVVHSSKVYEFIKDFVSE